MVLREGHILGSFTCAAPPTGRVNMASGFDAPVNSARRWRNLSDGRTGAVRGRLARWLPTLLVLLPWLLSPLSPDSASRIEQDTGPTHFLFWDWEAVHLAAKFGEVVSGLVSPPSPQSSDAALAQAYFQTPDNQRGPIRATVEGAIERAIASVYQASGVTRATPFGERVFPPFIISITPPPNILIVAPRNALVIEQSVMLKTDLDTAAQEALEQSTESLGGVSALVTPIGGIGASYPSMILEDASPRVTVRRAAHEWVHQYLFFSPLGQAYWRSQEAREINESAADLVSAEVGDRAFDLLGLHDPPAPPGPTPPPPLSTSWHLCGRPAVGSSSSSPQARSTRPKRTWTRGA